MTDRTIVVPPRLVARLDAVVARLAEITGDDPDACRRIVEAGLLQRGLVSLEDDLREGGKLARRMGWPEGKAG